MVQPAANPQTRQNEDTAACPFGDGRPDHEHGPWCLEIHLDKGLSQELFDKLCGKILKMRILYGICCLHVHGEASDGTPARGLRSGIPDDRRLDGESARS